MVEGLIELRQDHPHFWVRVAHYSAPCFLELHLLHDLIGSFLLGLPLAVNGRVSDVAERDPRLATERPPDGSRQVEQQRLARQEQRNPLVVADVVAPLLRLGIVLVERQVVSIGCPAVLAER